MSTPDAEDPQAENAKAKLAPPLDVYQPHIDAARAAEPELADAAPEAILEILHERYAAEMTRDTAIEDELDARLEHEPDPEAEYLADPEGLDWPEHRAYLESIGSPALLEVGPPGPEPEIEP